ncbi:DUF922 domain-containing protein [Mucilaginibacter ginsenosidivorans]|uniref:DUF922 domain-containing protein n=1 Tax=Mucilaginibacter ginsenosidivorans TaxID=398053 RepID=A0A5B8UV09_9SPHI|nr:DUF922 domain-containing protein [Mucilaginibacter ginsenosidivorans]QEC62605.1 DUF922 domain-containing protein [Mucilaginibacter ginsenosidivorans]
MKRRSVSVILTVLLSTVFLVGSAQPYRVLTVNDFRGIPQHTGPTIAETNCFVDLRYDVHQEGGNCQLTFHVALTMDNERSWIDRSRITSAAMLADILKHEQGHYNISYFEGQELLFTLNRMHFSTNYKVEVEGVFDRIHGKYKQLNADYDDDTLNSKNSIQQTSWDKYFQRKLAYQQPANHAALLQR